MDIKKIKEKFSNLKMKEKSFALDAVSGSNAGLVAGATVGPIEYIKVEFQKETCKIKRIALLKNPTTYKNMAKAMFSFAPIFAGVCGVEFSVNKRLGDQYGKTAGIVGSAFTGAFFLTAADHLMYRRSHGQTATSALKQLSRTKFTSIWTGFSPMVFREAVFICSVMYLGPHLGQFLKRLQGGSDEDTIIWSSIGRIVTGVSTTLITQPFDVMARQLQIQLFLKPKERPTFSNCIQRMFLEYKETKAKALLDPKKPFIYHPLFNGALPRMFLATIGGVLAAGLYDHFRGLYLLSVF